MFDAVFWDMDGTLVDTERKVWSATRRAFVEILSLDIEETFFESMLGRSEKDFFRDAASLLDLSQADVERLRRGMHERYLDMLRDIEPLPGAAEAVRALEGRLPQALVTGSTSAQAEAVLSALGLADAFAVRVTCDHYERGKPDPEPFLHAARALGVAPSRGLAIEDSPAGVAAAKAAGMRVVGVHEGNGGRYDIGRADLELPSLQGFDWEELLARLAGC